MALINTKDDVTAGKGVFANHYSFKDSDDDICPGSDLNEISIKWTDFKDVIDTYVDFDSKIEENIVLTFIHRYDKSQSEWFLTMEGGHYTVVEATTIDDVVVYPVTPIPDSRYDLKDKTIPYASSFKGDYDQEYFDNFYYIDGTSSSPLSDDTDHDIYVKSISLLWFKEIYQLYLDNIPSSEENGILYIHFASFSGTAAETGDANVQYPHTLVVYMKVGSSDLLDNVTYPTALFEMKAADFGSMCPPHCDEIIIPKNLAQR